MGTDLKLKLCTKRLYTTTYVTHLGILIDDKLKWNTDASNVVSKLMISKLILSKLRHYVNKEILRTIYYVIFHSYLPYATKVWGQTRIPQKYATVLQKKTLRIMGLHHLILIHRLIYMITIC